MRIRDKIKDFELLVIGKGHEAKTVESFAKQHPWVHYVGPKFGTEKTVYFKIASLLLLPAAVGLAVLDAFAMETPLITTDISNSHGPEIDYLDNDVNGLITQHSISDYSNAIINILSSDHKLETLVNGCKESSLKYNLEQMVENFKTGIISCLKM